MTPSSSLISSRILHDRVGQDRIEAGDRFIGQDHLRILHHRPGDSDPLLLTAGQLVGPGVGLLTETDLCSCATALATSARGNRLMIASAGIDVAEPSGQHVGDHLRAVHEIEMLEDHADPATDQAEVLLGRRRYILAVPEDASGGRLDQAIDAAQEGRLARPRQTDDGQELPVGDLEGHVTKRDRPVVIDLGEVLNLEH